MFYFLVYAEYSFTVKVQEFRADDAVDGTIADDVEFDALIVITKAYGESHAQRKLLWVPISISELQYRNMWNDVAFQ